MKNLLIVILLALGIFFGFVYYKTGNIPVRDWSEQFQRDGLAGTVNKISTGQFVDQAKKIANDVIATDVKQDTFAAPPAGSVQIYKWTDAKGVVHYDNQPVKGATELSINPDANVVPMEKATEVAPTEQAPTDEAKLMMENIEKMRRAKEARMGI